MDFEKAIIERFDGTLIDWVPKKFRKVDKQEFEKDLQILVFDLKKSDTQDTKTQNLINKDKEIYVENRNLCKGKRYNKDNQTSLWGKT